ncbi:MAG: M36 family metallopeptidase [Phycisphaerales bacterium]
MRAPARPLMRSATIVAHDPSLRREGRILTAQVRIPDERFAPGPWSSRFHVVDYDSTTHTMYRPREENRELFDDPNPSESVILGDPGFHASNAFVIATRTLELFQRALGRRLSWSFPGHQVKIVPHAFRESNAFYSDDLEALLFGYFPGRDGMVYTCLSHDIIVHETTHAILDGLRTRYADPSSSDQGAFHEGFADLVALMSVFSLPEVVGALLDEKPGAGKRIRATRLTEQALRTGPLLAIAEQFGEETSGVRGRPLRRSLELTPSTSYYLREAEFRSVHRRGEILVAAVLSAFVKVWAARVKRLGTEKARDYDADAVVEEGARAAQHLLTMAIRAIDYTPPCHLTFGDYLSALLTADREMYPDGGKHEYPALLRKSFAEYGVKPTSRQKDGAWRVGLVDESVELSYHGVHHDSLRYDRDEVFRFAWENREALGLREDAYTRVLSVRPCIRIDRDGFTLRETVAEVHQQIDLTAGELGGWGVKSPRGMERTARVTLYGGCVLVFDEFGKLKYNIHNSIANADAQACRLASLWEAGAFKRDRRTGELRLRGGTADFAALHRARSRGAAVATTTGAGPGAEEGWPDGR